MSNCEVFRRSALTLLPHWAAAATLTLTGLWAADRFGLPLDWVALLMASLPLAWAAARGLQWVATTWTVTADGNLILRSGIISRQRQVIPLSAMRRADVQPSFAGHRMDVGHLSVEVVDRTQAVRFLQWTWLARPDQLQQILCCPKEAAFGPSSRRRQTADWPMAPTQAAVACQTPDDAFGKEYRRFLDFCQLLLAAEEGASWPPPGITLAEQSRWMGVLCQARIVVDSPNGRGWRAADTIKCLADVTHRVGYQELKQAMQRPLIEL